MEVSDDGTHTYKRMVTRIRGKEKGNKIQSRIENFSKKDGDRPARRVASE